MNSAGGPAAAAQDEHAGLLAGASSSSGEGGAQAAGSKHDASAAIASQGAVVNCSRALYCVCAHQWRQVGRSALRRALSKLTSSSLALANDGGSSS